MFFVINFRYAFHQLKRKSEKELKRVVCHDMVNGFFLFADVRSV